jgi:threonine efflux protein
MTALAFARIQNNTTTNNMNIHAFLAAFWAVQGLFAVNLAIPGSNFVLISRMSLSRGRLAGWAVSLGASAGDALFAALALGGLAALASKEPGLIQGIALAGGMWLAWMGFKMVLGAKAISLENEEKGEGGSWPFSKCFRLGLSATLVNPQTVIFFSAVLAAGSAGSLAGWQSAGMWGGFALVSLTMRGSIAWLFATQKARAAYARFKLPMNYMSGSALAVFGGKTALHALPFWAAKAHLIVLALGAA